jgi:2-methylcitrate dehydratase PrpD
MKPGSVLFEFARWAVGLKLEAVPADVREHAKNQVLSIVAAVYSGYASGLGHRIEAAFAPAGLPSDPAAAAFALSAWSMVLDFDDVMLGGHTGHSSVLVPLAFARAGQYTGADVLVAQIAANEVAARLNMSVALGPARGQMAAHLHLASATVARGRLEGLDAETLAHALALALSYPPKALYPAFLGSDAKVLCASWPVRMGLDAVDAARCGLRGNIELLEGRHGLLRTLTETPVRNFFGGLGERWHTVTNSYKVHPGSGYGSAAIQAALSLVRCHNIQPESVQSIDIWGSLFTTGMEAHVAPFLGTSAPVAALTFSAAYAVACAVRYRECGPEQFEQFRVDDPQLRELLTRIRVRHDPNLTVKALLAEIPVGAALRAAGRRATLRFLLNAAGKLPQQRSVKHLLQRLRVVLSVTLAAHPRPLNFSAAEKCIGARVVVTTTDGCRQEETVLIPAGFAGSGGWDMSRLLMRQKFFRYAPPITGRERALHIAELIESLETVDACGLSTILELNAARNAVY